MAPIQKPESVDAPRIITPTLEELKSSSYQTPNIESALEALSQDGFVVLKNVVDVAHVDHLNSLMTKEADDLVKNKAKPFNQGVDCTCMYRYNDRKLKSISQHPTRAPTHKSGVPL